MNSGKDYDYLFKVILIGKPGSGKRSTLIRFTDNSYSESDIVKSGIDFKLRTIDVDGKKVKLQVWAASNNKHSDTSLYSGAAISILTFDLTNSNALEDINELYKTANTYSDTTVTLMAGTKADD